MTDFLAGRRILVVEDEMLVLMNIEMAFADMGCCDLYAAANVAEALALLDKISFDAAIVDVNLGGEKATLSPTPWHNAASHSLSRPATAITANAQILKTDRSCESPIRAPRSPRYSNGCCLPKRHPGSHSRSGTQKMWQVGLTGCCCSRAVIKL